MSMRVLPILDLPYLIKGEDVVKGTVYGVLREEVVPPPTYSRISPVSPTDCYAAVDVVGITFEEQDYYVRGQLLTVVPKSLLEAAKKKPSGRLAVVMTDRPLKLAGERSGLTHFVTMFGWRKAVAGSSWAVYPPKIAQMSRTTVPEFLAVVQAAYANDWDFVYPIDIPEGYTDACDGYAFKAVAPAAPITPVGVSEGSAAQVSGQDVPAVLAGWGAPPTVDPSSGQGSVQTVLTRGGGALPEVQGDFGLVEPSTPAGASGKAQPEGGGTFQGRKELAPLSKNYPIMVEAFSGAEERVQELLNEMVAGSAEALIQYVMVPDAPGVDASVIEKEVLSNSEGDDFEDYVSPTSEDGTLVLISDEEGVSVEEDVDDFEGEYEEMFSPIFRPLVDFTAERLRSSWTRKVGHTTGRALFKLAMERSMGEQHTTEQETGTTEVDDYLEYFGLDLLKYWVGEYRVDPVYMGGIRDEAIRVAQEEGRPEPNFEKYFNMGKQAEDFLKALAGVRHAMYFRMISSLLSLSEAANRAVSATWMYDIEAYWLMPRNPYKLCLIDSSISVIDMDKLAMFYGVDRNDPEVIKARNVAYMHNYMLDSSNWIIKDNTVVEYWKLRNKAVPGYSITKTQYDVLRAEGRLVQESRLQSAQYFIREELDYDSFALPTTNWTPIGRKFSLRTDQRADTMVQDYIDSGVGIRVKLNGKDLVASIVFFKKELYIYDKLRSMAENKIDISEEDLKKCVADFEALKDQEYGLPAGTYKLEERQADAIMMSGNQVMCLIGPAGSGKTTTVEARVYASETVVGSDPDRLMFCAPTGKAAGRLKEVVKRRTSTVNSLFQIGGEGVSLMEEPEIREKDELETLVMDESSMPNILLFYEMMRRVNEHTSISFLGDIEQLPPIGFGKPFANLLSFLPTVALNINKRSSEKSTIAKNNKRIIYESDDAHMEDLIDGPDYRIVHETDQHKVVNHIYNICKYHLGKGESPGLNPVENNHVMNPDDIQVISPVNVGVWGINELNNRLQDIFNPRKGMVIKHSRSKDHTLEYRLGDRVIHTRKNWKKHHRFNHDGGTTFTYHHHKDNVGINNGDMGKIIGFYRSEDLYIQFNKEISNKDRQAILRHYRPTSKKMYVGVQYKDVDLTSGEIFEFVCFYRMTILLDQPHEIAVISTELENLDLAYALTVHRLQGSQAKLIIMAILQVGSGGSFISRNMIYTASSRAQESAYLIGDVYGSDSAVNKGRRVKQTEIRSTLLDYL